MMNKTWKMLTLLYFFTKLAMAAEVFDNSISPPHFQLINRAVRSLDIEIYTMDDPNIRAAIAAAQSRGVHIRIVQEPTPVGKSCHVFEFPNASDDIECGKMKAFVSDVRSAGGKYVPYNKAAFCSGNSTCFEHGKLLIVDGREALISTGNFDRTSICDVSAGATRCNRDFSVVTADAPSVSTLERIFTADFAGMPYDLQNLVTHLPPETLTVSPYSLPPLLQLIGSARRSIHLENQYLHDPDLNRALIDAAHRGVRVELEVASICSFGRPSPSEAGKLSADAQSFAAAGIVAHAFTGRNGVGGRPGYLHSKVIVVDGNLAWVGSVNGSATSLSTNREYGIFLKGQSEMGALDGILMADFRAPGSTTLQEDVNCR